MKKNSFKICCLLIAFLAFSTLFAQSGTVSGTVTDRDDGAPIPGVNVFVKGTTNGTSTDFDGNYAIDVASGTVLVFSYIGYGTQEIAIEGQNTINVSLSVNADQLDEVVIIGYGTSRKADLTGSVSSLKAEVFQEQPVTTLEEGIQGRLTGVQVVQSSGQPGAGTSIRIRGVASLSGTSEPLFVIDGVPQFNTDVNTANGFSNIDPNNIESIEVLKDAASTAIYGSRAANGVVLITTKQGKSGKTTFSYNTFVGVQSVRNELDLMSGQEYFDFVTEYFNNSIADGDLTVADRDQALAEFQITGINNTDWQDLLYESAIRQSHNVTASGGANGNRFFVSGSYLNNEGVVSTTGFERVSLRINLDNKISERFSLATRLSGSRSFQNRFVGNDGTNNTLDGKSGIGAILTTEPTIAPRDANGNVSDARPYGFSAVNNENPLGYLESVDEREAYRFQGILEGRLKLFKGLQNTTRLGATYDRSQTDVFLSSSIFINSQQVDVQTDERLDLLFENFVTYDTQIAGDLNLNAVAGFAYQRDTRNRLRIQGQGLPTDDLATNSLQSLSSISPPVTFNDERVLSSVFGRLNLNFKNKYLLSGSIRRDGASQFAEGSKFVSLPGISAGWRVSEENFLADSKLISNLKLRASWGVGANQGIEPFQSLFVGNPVNTPQGSGNGLNTGLAPNLANRDLTWETSTQTNLGFDLGFKNQGYRIGFDWYKKNTEDLLAEVLLPSSSGFTEILANIGEIENTGIEISAAADFKVSKDLNFQIDANFSRNENTVVRTNNGDDTITGDGNDGSGTTLLVREGESLSSFFMLRFLGLDADGNPMFEDVDGNGVFDDSDRQIVGSSLPDFVYGINMTTNYKRLSLTMNWQGVSGQSIFNQRLPSLVSPGPGISKRRDLRDFFPRPSVQAGRLNRGSSSRFLEDGSYLRLKNVRLNYALPTDIFEWVSNFNIYVSAQNLITITDYSGYDPEVNSFSGNDLRQGVDLSSYPSVRTFTLGLNVSF